MGVALAGTLGIIYVICALFIGMFPGPRFSHMWLQNFSVSPMGSGQMWLEGIIASLVVGFVAGYIFASLYNWVSKKWA